jgi:TRAP-type C4-dicarboxylate transport system permease small subunit
VKLGRRSIKPSKTSDVALSAAENGDADRFSALGLLLAGLLLGLLVVVFIQVVVRYATYQPLAWTEEVARLLFIWTCMAGAAVGAKRGSHFAVTLIFDMMPAVSHRPIKVALLLMEAAFYAVLTWSALIVTRVAHNQHSPSLEFPMSFSYAALMISGAVMCLFALWRMVKIARGRI